MFACEFCHEKYDQQSSLLRHITHKKVCHEFYGQTRVSQMKRQARLLSKRKWSRSQSPERRAEKVVTERTKHKKSGYIPVSITKSDQGTVHAHTHSLSKSV